MTTAIRIARALLWLVYAWVVVTVVLLFLAFLLQLFGANPTAGFVQWVYRSTQRAMAPFRGIFEPVPLSDQSVLDTSILFAMIVYGFVGMGLNLAVEWVTRKLREAEAHDRATKAVDHGSATRPGRTDASLVYVRSFYNLGDPIRNVNICFTTPVSGYVVYKFLSISGGTSRIWHKDDIALIGEDLRVPTVSPIIVPRTLRPSVD